MIATPPLVPELDVADLAASLAIYTDVFGFTLFFARSDEAFAYIVQGGAHLMLQQADGPGRRFRTAPLARPYGRGINLQIRVADIDALHARARAAKLDIVVPIEDRWYAQGQVERGHRQCVVADPDGYLLRFFSDLGESSAA